MATAVLLACTDEGQKQITADDINALQKEVIQIHDAVMPKMSDIARLMNNLEQEAGKSDLDTMMHKEIARSIAKLQAGDSLMWEWMHNYSVPENVSTDSLYRYLRNEKERMTRVRNAMEEGIEYAERVSQKLGYGKPN